MRAAQKRKRVITSSDEEDGDEGTSSAVSKTPFSVLTERNGKSIQVKGPPQHVLNLLKDYFGHSSFRPMQWDIVKNALDGKDQLVLMSTGYGKSVCYQLPGLITNSLTLVISPLISLMNDQVRTLSLNGTAACLLSGTTSHKEKDSIMLAISEDTLRLVSAQNLKLSWRNVLG
ncbi:unnamed protein product [Strongylus vulgaris]|uniref:DEAD/DEAH-box helicase domain-containing protein n=1 Tax=Strongylus vulgaris TaxID=40348 RepID=A0A3P7IVE8_STRVU|nr:unnamed protein product [Strongylus vulgaris]